MKNKKNAKERREEEKKKRLNNIINKVNGKKSKSIVQPESEETIEEELKENSKVIDDVKANDENNPFSKKEEFRRDIDIFIAEKNELQKEIDYMRNPEIKEMPDFLTNPEKADERKAVMDKVMKLLKYKYSLISIADVLECNDYDRLDEMLERKNELKSLVEKYTGENGQRPISLFAGFKKIVGDENFRVYLEQEDRMRAAISHIQDGKYFKTDKENPEIVVEDIIAKIIDHPDFSLACQIEAEFTSYEMERAYKALSDLGMRAEIAVLLDELRTVSLESDQRAHSYKVINGLISNYSKDIIEKNDDQR